MCPYIAAEERLVDECNGNQALPMGKEGEERKLCADVTIIGLLDRREVEKQRAFEAVTFSFSNCSPNEGAHAEFCAVLTYLCTWSLEL